MSKQTYVRRPNPASQVVGQYPLDEREYLVRKDRRTGKRTIVVDGQTRPVKRIHDEDESSEDEDEPKEDEYRTVVAERTRPIVMLFLRRVFLILLLTLSTTLGLTYWATRNPELSEMALRQPWLYGMVIVMFVMVMIMYLFAHYSSWSRGAQWVGLGFTVVTLTASMILLSSYFQTDLLLRASSLTIIIIFSLFLYTLQTRWGFSPTWAAVYIMVAATAGLVFLYWPNLRGSGVGIGDWNKDDWLKPPTGSWELVVTIILSLGFCLYLIYQLNVMMRNCTPRHYVYAAFHLYVNGVYIFTIFFRLSCTCAAQKATVVKSIV